MRNALPFIIKLYEAGIVNLDAAEGQGTHWVAYWKDEDRVVYFDSYGNLKPPQELVTYFNSAGDVSIAYNYSRRQFKSYNCGHLCLEFLNKINNLAT